MSSLPILFDQYGVPYQSEDAAAPARPEGIELYLQTPKIEVLAAWDAAAAKACSIAHDLGQFTISAPMYYAMMSDPFIVDGCDKRNLALRRAQFDIVPGKGRGAKMLARQLAKHYAEIMQPQIAGELYNMGLLLGLSVAQPEWAYYYEGDDLFYPHVKTWHPQLLYYLMWAQMNRHKAAPGQLYTYAMGSEDGMAATLIPIIAGTGQWMQFALYGGDKPWLYGKLRSVWRPWIGTMLARAQWLRFNDVHGLPIREFQTPMNMRKNPDVRRSFRTIERIGRDAAIEAPMGTDGKPLVKLNLIEAKSRSYGSFDLFMERGSREIMLALTGGLEGVQAHGTNYKRAQEQMDVRHETKAADALAWETFLNTQLCIPFAVLNGFDPEAAPQFVYDTRPPVNRQVEAKATSASLTAIQDFVKTTEELKRVGVRLSMASVIELMHNQGLELPDSVAEEIAYGLTAQLESGEASPDESPTTDAASVQEYRLRLRRRQEEKRLTLLRQDVVRAYRFLGLGEDHQEVLRPRLRRLAMQHSHVVSLAA